VDIDVRTVTVDLTRVGFTSLGALHALVDAAADLERHGGRLTLLGTTPLQDRVLALLDAPAALVIAPDPVG